MEAYLSPDAGMNAKYIRRKQKSLCSMGKCSASKEYCSDVCISEESREIYFYKCLAPEFNISHKNCIGLNNALNKLFLHISR